MSADHGLPGFEHLPKAALRAGADVRSRLSEHGLDVVAVACVVVVRAPEGAPMPYYVGDSYPLDLLPMDRQALVLGLAQAAQNVQSGKHSEGSTIEAEARAVAEDLAPLVNRQGDEYPVDLVTQALVKFASRGVPMSTGIPLLKGAASGSVPPANLLTIVDLFLNTLGGTQL